jgi:hypothetical protein
LPNWDCRNERDAKELIEWTIAQLDKERAITESFIHAGDYGPPHPTLLPTIEWALEVAKDHGDMTLLQKIVEVEPEYAKYLRSPARQRGRPPKPKDDDAMWQAAFEVRLIRHIWKEHFGKFKRSLNDKVTAEQIAALRWKGVDAEELRKIDHHKK